MHTFAVRALLCTDYLFNLLKSFNFEGGLSDVCP